MREQEGEGFTRATGSPRGSPPPHREEAQMAEGGPRGGGVGGTGGARGWDGQETTAVQEGPARGSPKPTYDIFTVPF